MNNSNTYYQRNVERLLEKQKTVIITRVVQNEQKNINTIKNIVRTSPK